MDLMEQKVHELNARYLEMKEERDQVIAENEELQEQLDMTNTSASLGMQKINEVKIEVQKLAEEVNKIDYATTTQEHELKTLSDHMCDLNSLKETVKEHNEEIATIKEDYTRMKTHLNVSVSAIKQELFKSYVTYLMLLTFSKISKTNLEDINLIQGVSLKCQKVNNLCGRQSSFQLANRLQNENIHRNI